MSTFPADGSTAARPLLSALLISLCTSTLPAQAPPVDVVPVRGDTIASGAKFVGTIEPVKRAVIGSAVDGRVQSIFVEEGQRIEAAIPEEAASESEDMTTAEFGIEAEFDIEPETEAAIPDEDEGVTPPGHIAQILTSTIEYEWEAAKRELELREAERDEIKKTPRPEELDRLQAQADAAEAAVRYAKSNFERMEQLYRGGSTTSDAYESAKSAFTTASEVFNERTAAVKLAEPLPELLAQAEAKVRLQQEVVARLADQIKKYTVRTRFPGYVVAKHTEEGAWVKRGDPVAEVVYLDEVDAVVHVLESQIRHVRRGTPVNVEIPAMPDLEPPLRGEIAQIVPQADTRTRTFPVKVRIENRFEDEVPVVKSGMLVRVELPTGPKRESLLVPKDALVLGRQTPIVYVATPEAGNETVASVRPVPVELGVADGNWIAVTGELSEGDLVVTRGNERIRPGQQVSPREPKPEADTTDVAKP